MDIVWRINDNGHNACKICKRRSFFHPKKYLVSFLVLVHCFCSIALGQTIIEEKYCLTSPKSNFVDVKNSGVDFEFVLKSSESCISFFKMINVWKSLLPSDKIIFAYAERLSWDKQPIAGLFVHGFQDQNSILFLASSLLEKETFVHEISSYFFAHANMALLKEWDKLHSLHSNRFHWIKGDQKEFLSKKNPWDVSFLHLKYGFLCNYSLSSSENDFNMYAQYYYSGRPDQKGRLTYALEISEIAKIKFSLFERMMPTNVSF